MWWRTYVDSMERVKDTGVAGRRCRLTKRQGFDGYGFVLRSKKKHVGHYIDAIEDSSPAQRAGVRVGDRVISVNGRCVRHRFSHKQVSTGKLQVSLVDRWVKFRYTAIVATAQLKYALHL